MGLQILTEPHLFLGGLSAIGNIGGQPLPLLLTSYYSWTNTPVAETSSFSIPIEAGAIYNGPNNSSNYIVDVGGVVQSPLLYSIDDINRTITFTSLVCANVPVSFTQLGTRALSTQTFTEIDAVSATFAYLSAVELFANSISTANLFTSVTSIELTVQQVSSLVIDCDSTDAALRVTQIGSGDVLLVEDSLNPDSTPFIITSGGYVGIGTIPNESLTVVGTISTDSHGNSELWNSAYTTVRNLSAQWEESADILPTVTNYLSTDLVTISSLNVTQQLLSGNVDLQTIFLTPQNTLTTTICAMSGDSITPFVMNFTNGLLTSITF